jgi:hypothetical protein
MVPQTDCWRVSIYGQHLKHLQVTIVAVMSPWALPWWEWFLLAVALYIVRRLIYSEHPGAFTFRFCLLVAMLLAILMGAIRLFRISWGG